MATMSTTALTANPPDDANGKLTPANPDNPGLRHVSAAGGTGQTNGRYCLIDMLVLPGGGPPPHRHDYEELFTILEGEIELTFRGEMQQASACSTLIRSGTSPISPRACSACARQQGRTSFSWRLATRSTAAPHPCRSSARPSRLNEDDAQRLFRPSSRPRPCRNRRPRSQRSVTFYAEILGLRLSDHFAMRRRRFMGWRCWRVCSCVASPSTTAIHLHSARLIERPAAQHIGLHHVARNGVPGRSVGLVQQVPYVGYAELSAGTAVGARKDSVCAQTKG